MLDFTLLAAAVFALIFLLGRKATPLFENYQVQMRSLGGGLAVAYAFLTLFPEIEKGHELFGDSIHVVVLVGLLAFLGAERWLEKQAEEQGDHAGDTVFGLTVALAWIYVWLVVFTIPEKLEGSWTHSVVGIAGLSLHLLFKDHSLHEANHESHMRWGRWVLALAPLVGWAMETFLVAESEAIADVVLALLAGSIFYEVFREELPSQEESHYGWFVGGALLYALLSMGAEAGAALS